MRWLTILLAIALPFLVYALWLRLERGRRRAAARGDRWPWSWLVLAALLLVVVYLLSLRIFGWDPDGLLTGPSLLQRGQG